MKIKVSIGFVLIVLFVFVVGNLKSFILFFSMICIHDIAHYLVARYYGAQVESIELMPFGCEIRLYESLIEDRQKAFIYLAGPLTNIFIAVILSILKHSEFVIFPLYDDILFSNLILGFLNILPLYPLDGSVVMRILISKFLGNIKAVKVMLIVTEIFACFLIAVTIYCFINGIYNASYGIVGVFMYTQVRKKRENLLIDAMKGEVNKRAKLQSSRGLIKSERICVNWDMTLKKLLNYFNANKYYIIEVIDRANRYVTTITEEDVIDGIINYGYNCTIKDILK